MNAVSQAVNNFLVIKNENDHNEELFKLCLAKVKQGLLVLILTSKTYDFTHLLEVLDMSKEDLKSFIVINFKNINDMSKKLMDLHDWTLLPSMVVVDISDMLSHETLIVSPPIMQSVTLCAASLLNYLDTVAVQKSRQLELGKDINPNVDGVLIVKMEEQGKFDNKQLQVLKDLYFYNNKSPVDLKALSKILNR